MTLRFYKDQQVIYEDTARLDSKTSVGFEWEIPVARDFWNIFWNAGASGKPRRDFERRFVERVKGFRFHYECGGLEVRSPVTHNLSTTRKYAKAVTDFASKEVATLIPDRAPNARNNGTSSGECCGIHVHVQNPRLFENDSIVFKRLVLMMHRSATKDFIFQISGRNMRSDYSHQAVTIQWENTLNRDNRFYNISSLYNYVASRSYMTKLNCHTTGSTLEFRLWDARKDRLPVAIDMAHSLVTFMVTRRRNKSLSPETIPTLFEWAAWVKKQKGYRSLRNDPVFISHFA